MEHHRGNQHFNNTWSSFRNGFHDNEAHEYYIGNQAFWYLSTLSHYILRFDMWSEDGTHICAEFGGVAVTSEADGYALSFDEYLSGTATDGGIMSYHSGQAFGSHDNESSDSLQCATAHQAGWWYMAGDMVSTADADVALVLCSECYVTLLTSAEEMTWARVTNNSDFANIALDSVVMRMRVDPRHVASE